MDQQQVNQPDEAPVNMYRWRANHGIRLFQGRADGSAYVTLRNRQGLDLVFVFPVLSWGYMDRKAPDCLRILRYLISKDQYQLDRAKNFMGEQAFQKFMDAV